MSYSDPQQRQEGGRTCGLPTTYDELCKYSIAYRKAIYAELDPTVRSTLWVRHLRQYRRDHPDMSVEQRRVHGEIERMVADVRTFRADPKESIGGYEALTAELIAAFGKEEARALVATLGPVESPANSTRAELMVACECQSIRPHDFCFFGQCSGLPSCTWQSGGCGWLYQYPCDGMCT
ncbi:bacteriocin fulvocin C-related protein [Nonomuraea sp. K274]|uniref:Bacteriocin fulvocin C-related protein n=1 Tax=Nonomuraea cypriaca TaxID=1187855 RepID=A0A931A4F2_9ACTN|nr:bacteriocin fulvocin C-related protein [Nonomuraea cypriaca]MBF8184830.1 bacteriocin fulvocin C-related protein [Nonomuraea cypriaca]